MPVYQKMHIHVLGTTGLQAICCVNAVGMAVGDQLKELHAVTC